jgi:hypothetical protein
LSQPSSTNAPLINETDISHVIDSFASTVHSPVVQDDNSTTGLGESKTTTVPWITLLVTDNTTAHQQQQPAGQTGANVTDDNNHGVQSVTTPSAFSNTSADILPEPSSTKAPLINDTEISHVIDIFASTVQANVSTTTPSSLLSSTISTINDTLNNIQSTVGNILNSIVSTTTISPSIGDNSSFNNTGSA